MLDFALIPTFLRVGGKTHVEGCQYMSLSKMEEYVHGPKVPPMALQEQICAWRKRICPCLKEAETLTQRRLLDLKEKLDAMGKLSEYLVYRTTYLNHSVVQNVGPGVKIPIAEEQRPVKESGDECTPPSLPELEPSTPEAVAPEVDYEAMPGLMERSDGDEAESKGEVKLDGPWNLPQREKNRLVREW